MLSFSMKKCLLLLMVWFLSPIVVHAGSLDIYIVYVSSESALKKSLKGKLSQDHGVKVFNAGGLATADYSGKQKAISRISSANLVVLLTDKPLTHFDGYEFEKFIVVSSDSVEELEKIVAALR